MFLIILLVMAMIHWWYWWSIPSVMLLLISWGCRSWYPAMIGIPLVLIVFSAVAVDIMGRGMR